MTDGVLHPHQLLGFVRDTTAFEHTLAKGDGIAWPGDEDMELHQGVVTSPNGREILARRWEVWRNCEDGKCRIIGHWRIEEFDKIIFDLARMRPEAPGHVSVEDVIDAANDKIEAKNSAQFRDSMGAAIDHGARLLADTTGPKQTFRQMPGMRDLDTTPSEPAV